ncbi:MAG: hypothetical protein ACK5LT_13930 [Lachnospirales bacterium]
MPQAIKKTYLNLTNHSYFNLSLKENIYNHYLQINANKFLEMDHMAIPINTASVENTDFDFRKQRKIGNFKNSEDENIKKSNGYNHTYILNKKVDYDLTLRKKIKKL